MPNDTSLIINSKLIIYSPSVYSKQNSLPIKNENNNLWNYGSILKLTICERGNPYIASIYFFSIKTFYRVSFDNT